MIDFISLIRSIEPTFSTIQESELTYLSQVVGFETTILDTEMRALAGGVGSNTQSSRQKAVSEVLEHSLFKILLARNDSAFKLSEFPTTCGFAVGFNRENTKQRAFNEALERWAWSKWIDDGFKMEETEALESPLGSFFCSHFEAIHCYQHTFHIDDVPLLFAVTLGLIDGGVFAGSRVSSDPNECWEHSLSESYRHYLIFQKRRPIKDLFHQRIFHFGTNGHEAQSQIDHATSLNWPAPDIDFCRELITNYDQIYAFRALLKNYIGWHLGDCRRFVY